MKILNKIDETLFELFLGILTWGVFWQVAGVWFVADKAGCSLGLWIGVILALFSAAHMYRTLDRALEQSEKDAQKMVTSQNMIRYAVIVVILGILVVTEAANPLTGFLGVMGLKAAAYMQPFTHKLITKRRR